MLRCPVYATPFAAAMLEGPLEEAGLTEQVPIRLLTESATFEIGPFALERIPLTHSTVEMGALVIRTDAGTVLHTGDWKLDPEPIVGRPTDESALKRLRTEGIDVLVSDSTNADVPGWTPSEGELPASLRRVFAGRPGRIAVPFFSTNVARLATLGALAQEQGRSLVLVGRSLERTLGAAQRVGYLDDLPAIVPASQFGYLPPDRVLLLCTGSQGEPQARAGADRGRRAPSGVPGARRHGRVQRPGHPRQRGGGGAGVPDAPRQGGAGRVPRRRAGSCQRAPAARRAEDAL